MILLINYDETEIYHDDESTITESTIDLGHWSCVNVIALVEQYTKSVSISETLYIPIDGGWVTIMKCLDRIVRLYALVKCAISVTTR